MELALPITIYWDLNPSEPASAELEQIAGDILTVRPLMLQILDPSPQASQGLLQILRTVQGFPLKITLTAGLQFLLAGVDASVAGFGRVELLASISTPSDLQQLPTGRILGVSCPVTRENWRSLPEIVHECRSRGIARLVLPMQRLYGCEQPFLLTRVEQDELTRALERTGGTTGLNLTIHDPFLWRAFNPSIPFPQGGCQAANTMVAISPDRGVYPCPTLPVRLGSLKDQRFPEILVSIVKREFRRRLLEFPAACDACAELAVCKGGCRGRSFAMQGTFDAIDQACR